MFNQGALNIAMLGGMRVVVKNPYQVSIKRSWKERLFSRPWQPLKTHDTEFHELIKDGEVLIDKVNHIIYCNQKMYHKLMEIKL